MKRIKTKFTGVYSRTLPSRIMSDGKPDVSYDITYKLDGRKVYEQVGLLSDGWGQKLAAQERSKRLRDISHGEELPKQKQKAPLFSEVVARYMEWATDNKTRAGYDDKNLYKNHLGPRFDSKRMSGITSFELERMKQELKAQGLAPATIAHCLKLMRQIFNKARVWGMYKGENVVKDVTMPKLQNERQRFLSQEEASNLVVNISKVSTQLADMTLLSLHTGMRASEIFNLKVHDLDFNNGLITISDAKNAESRKVYMTGNVRQAMQKYLYVRRANIPPSLKPPDAYIFTSKTGDKVKGISKTFSQIVNKLGLNKGYTDTRQHISFHSARHSFASWLAIQGESILTIGTLLGHKSPTMTRRYAHLSPDHKKRAVELLEKSFASKTDKTEEAQA